MKVKVIETCWAYEQEKVINTFLEENPNIEIIRTDIFSNVRFDRFTYGTNDICNTYYEFVTFIYYKEVSND